LLRSIKEILEAHKPMAREVFLDLENSGPVLPEVVKVMIPYFSEKAYGNPTITHKKGWEAYEVIFKASQIISKFIGASSSEEINFTYDEAEASNLAVVGAAVARKKHGRKILISNAEPLTTDLLSQELAKRGFKVVKVPVDEEGFVHPEKVAENIDKETILASIAAVNPEIGTIQPLKEIIEVAKSKNPEILFHTDASDAYGKIGFNVKVLNIDLATLSSRKIQGPRAVAALYVREGVELSRIIEGPLGTQRLWPGLENIPAIVGFYKASEICFRKFNSYVKHLKELRDRLTNGILETIKDVVLNGPYGNKRAPDNVNVSFLRCEGEALTIKLSLRGVYVSSGSACTRRLLQPSHILMAIGRSYEEAHGSILMKVSRQHKKMDIDYTVEQLRQAVERLRSISPM
jgi:cysteine desulfurase